METETEAQVEYDTRGLSRCHHAFGWHVYMAGPCFEKREDAIVYRDRLDARRALYGNRGRV